MDWGGAGWGGIEANWFQWDPLGAGGAGCWVGWDGVGCDGRDLMKRGWMRCDVM